MDRTFPAQINDRKPLTESQLLPFFVTPSGHFSAMAAIRQECHVLVFVAGQKVQEWLSSREQTLPNKRQCLTPRAHRPGFVERFS